VSVKDKYSFWEDRTVDGYRYRFSEYAIKRHPVGGPEHWLVWQDFETPRETARAWQKLCDQAAAEAKALL
jgi:hypothetical protein